MSDPPQVCHLCNHFTLRGLQCRTPTLQNNISFAGPPRRSSSNEGLSSDTNAIHRLMVSLAYRKPFDSGNVNVLPAGPATSTVIFLRLLPFSLCDESQIVKLRICRTSKPVAGNPCHTPACRPNPWSALLTSHNNMRLSRHAGSPLVKSRIEGNERMEGFTASSCLMIWADLVLLFCLVSLCIASRFVVH